eukprot:4653997-Pleurochrysis_carterae.AAC.1
MAQDVLAKLRAHHAARQSSIAASEAYSRTRLGDVGHRAYAERQACTRHGIRDGSRTNARTFARAASLVAASSAQPTWPKRRAVRVRA